MNRDRVRSFIDALQAVTEADGLRRSSAASRASCRSARCTMPWSRPRRTAPHRPAIATASVPMAYGRPPPSRTAPRPAADGLPDAEPFQRAERVRPQRNARAHRFGRGRLLVDGHVPSRPAQTDGGSQPADPRTHHDRTTHWLIIQMDSANAVLSAKDAASAMRLNVDQWM